MTNHKSIVAAGLAIVMAIGVAATVHGWSGQQNTLTFSGSVTGIVIDIEGQPLAHALLVSLGGTLVALSHLANLRLAHRHVHDAACGH